MPKKKTRSMTLDVFRGLTVALMIIVNSPGNQTAYSWLEHAPWHGCTLADLVFPFFILMVGTSAVFSWSAALSRGFTTQQLLPKIGKRTALLFLTGLLLNAFPFHFDWASLRVYGVLQRISLCYFAASLLYLTCPPRRQALIAAALLIGYGILLMFIPVPDSGKVTLSLEGNWAGYLDRSLLAGGHLYARVFDPEGLLSTLPAIATALMGNLLGIGLLSQSDAECKARVILATGLALMLTGALWGKFLPINKALWTSSYVLWTGGLALLLFSVCYWWIDIKGFRTGGNAFAILGTQALAVYILHVLFLKIQAIGQFPLSDGTVINTRLMITRTLFGFAKARNASLYYALLYCTLWWGVAWMMQKNTASRASTRVATSEQ